MVSENLPMKKSRLVNSPKETRRAPYQNTSAMTKKVNDCDKAKSAFDQMLVRLLSMSGCTSDSE